MHGFSFLELGIEECVGFFSDGGQLVVLTSNLPTRAEADAQGGVANSDQTNERGLLWSSQRDPDRTIAILSFWLSEDYRKRSFYLSDIANSAEYSEPYVANTGTDGA